MKTLNVMEKMWRKHKRCLIRVSAKCERILGPQCQSYVLKDKQIRER